MSTIEIFEESIYKSTGVNLKEITYGEYVIHFEKKEYSLSDLQKEIINKIPYFLNTRGIDVMLFLYIIQQMKSELIRNNYIINNNFYSVFLIGFLKKRKKVKNKITPSIIDFTNCMLYFLTDSFSGNLFKELHAEYKVINNIVVTKINKKSKKKTYLILDERNNYYKIGRSLNPLNRERTLQSEMPMCKLVFTMKSDIESHLHKLYASKRIRGEWFNLVKDDVEFIRSLKNKSKQEVIKIITKLLK